MGERYRFMAKLLGTSKRDNFELDQIDRFEPLRTRHKQEIILLAAEDLFDLDAYVNSKVIKRFLSHT